MKRSLTFAAVTVAASLGCLMAQSSWNAKPQDDLKSLKKAALQVDQYIAAFYRSKNLPVPEVTDDATFLRRAFLVSVGRIPTPEEALEFLEIQDPTKREALVEYLLKSKGFSSHMANWAFDLLRVVDGRGDFEPYRHWIRTAMANNMPWNEFTEHLISSSGDGWDPATAAVGYYTRDRGMPLDNVANTMRIFLGTRMECAQCHDDPFGTTERHDFYRLAAFTHGQGEEGREKMQTLWNELTSEKRDNNPEAQVARVIWDRVYGMSLGGGGTGQIELPTDYQYHDGKPGDVVGAHTPFGQAVLMSGKREKPKGREKLAGWIISKTGEQFPSVIANRMWKHVMGKGVYEPIDQFVPAAKSNYPELVGYIGKLIVDLGYDLRAFQHVLLLTKTFQFATNPNPSVVEGGDDFHGRKIERLSAEQIWDSLVTLAAGDPDKQPMRPLDERIYVAGQPVLVGKKSMPELSKEVLALKSEREVRAYFSKFLSEVKSDSPGNSGANSMTLMNDVRAYNKDAKIRASELPSPAPRDHFLYLFGASDREVVEASSREPNVGQVLSLMNGFVQRELVNKTSAHLYKTLDGATTEKEKVRRLYIAILSRPPSTEEMSWMLDEVKSQGDAGYRNIVSALVMSAEFLFLQ